MTTSRSTDILRPILLVSLLAVTITACQTPQPAPRRAAAADPWSAAFVPPMTLHTAQMHLEPLTPAHAQLDYDAFMSSRDHLHRTMHWGSWPRADTTVEENRTDLQRHEREFIAREAYAYAVLEPDRSASFGCIYINPVDDDPTAAKLAMWVTERAVARQRDEALLDAVLAWLESDWPFERVVLPMHVENVRGIDLAQRAGLSRMETEKENQVAFIWRR